MRSRLLALPITLALTALLSGCGAKSFDHQVAVTVTDADGKLTGPVAVSVFDPQMGFSQEWAQKWAGQAGPDQPYRTTVAMTGSQSVVHPGPPDRLDLALAIPADSEVGAYRFTVAAADGQTSTVPGILAPYYGKESEAAGTPQLPIQVTTKEGPDGWAVDLVVALPQATT